MNALTRSTASQAVPVHLTPEAAERVKGYVRAATATNTRRAYSGQWRAFSAWCVANGGTALPAAPETLVAYVEHLAQKGRKPATVDLALSAIGAAHTAVGLPSPRLDPRVRQVVSGMRRTLGTAPRQAAPLLAAGVRVMVGALGETAIGRRDRALILVGWTGALRRSELVALEVRDLSFDAEGLRVLVRRSKTDQEGKGRHVALPYSVTPAACPVRALRAWLDGAAITEGPVFREVNRHGQMGAAPLSGRSVSRILKRTAAAAGMDTERVSGHSLRAGFATQAAKSGKTERAIMRQTGHVSVAVARRYIRDAELWTDNAAAGLLG